MPARFLLLMGLAIAGPLFCSADPLDPLRSVDTSHSSAVKTRYASPIYRFAGYYIDSANRKHSAVIGYTYEYQAQYRVEVTDSGGTVHSCSPADIKGFGYLGDKGRAFVFRKVYYGNRFLFLKVYHDGSYLREYIYQYYYGPKNHGASFVFYRNDTLFPYTPATKLNNGRSRRSASRMFSDYPLLSEMALSGAFAFDLRERDVIIDEYNRWRADTSGGKMTDTAAALRGILDADRYYKPWRVFWGSALSNCFLTPVGGLVVMAIWLDKRPQTRYLHIPPQGRADNPAYLNAYRERAYTRKERAMFNGWVVGFLALALISIPLAND